ncbi:MAG TPA: pyrimidine 5'-nucleotidase [Devosiaceae bacterium]
MTHHAEIAPSRLEHVTDWVFDLDNTLYPRTCNLFAQIDRLITEYVVTVTGLETEAARKLQKDYYRDHGTTLSGLMALHGVDPDHYLATVHAIDYSPVAADPDLVGAIRALPGRKFIFTNADAGHARAVLARLGGEDLFDGVFDIRDAGYTPKPAPEPYALFLERHGIDPRRAAMFDDLHKNLEVPHAVGMATIQVVAGEDYAHEQVDEWELVRSEDHEHVHHVTSDLRAFLKALR